MNAEVRELDTSTKLPAPVVLPYIRELAIWGAAAMALRSAKNKSWWKSMGYAAISGALELQKQLDTDNDNRQADGLPHDAIDAHVAEPIVQRINKLAQQRITQRRVADTLFRNLPTRTFFRRRVPKRLVDGVITTIEDHMFHS